MTHSCALLDLFLFSDANICFTIVFTPSANSVVFAIFSEMFHGRISLNSVLLLLLLNFVSGLAQVGNDVYIYLTVNTKSSLAHLHGFELLVLLP